MKSNVHPGMSEGLTLRSQNMLKTCGDFVRKYDESGEESIIQRFLTNSIFQGWFEQNSIFQGGLGRQKGWDRNKRKEVASYFIYGVKEFARMRLALYGVVVGEG